jgi:hypothetical protein
MSKNKCGYVSFALILVLFILYETPLQAFPEEDAFWGYLEIRYQSILEQNAIDNQLDELLSVDAAKLTQEEAATLEQAKTYIRGEIENLSKPENELLLAKKEAEYIDIYGRNSVIKGYFAYCDRVILSYRKEILDERDYLEKYGHLKTYNEAIAARSRQAENDSVQFSDFMRRIYPLMTDNERERAVEAIETTQRMSADFQGLIYEESDLLKERRAIDLARDILKNYETK